MYVARASPVFVVSNTTHSRLFQAIIAFAIIFFVARLAHTITYLLAQSGARSLSWLAGLLSVVGAVIVVSVPRLPCVSVLGICGRRIAVLCPTKAGHSLNASV